MKLYDKLVELVGKRNIVFRFDEVGNIYVRQLNCTVKDSIKNEMIYHCIATAKTQKLVNLLHDTEVT